MDNENNYTIEEERKALIGTLEDMLPSDEDYRKTVEQIEALTKIQKMEVETDLASKKMEREANLAESKAKAELRIKEEEMITKRKESRRGVLKIVLAGLFGLGQIVLISEYENVKPLFGKAWNFVSKPKL